MRVPIILVSVLVLAATTATIIVGKNSFDGVVVDKPYETGLDWDKEQEMKARLGWAVAVKKGPFRKGGNMVVVTVLDKDRRPLRDAVVGVKVSRPSTTEFDRSYKTAGQPDGSHAASVVLGLHGYWNIIVDVSRGQDRARYERMIFAAR